MENVEGRKEVTGDPTGNSSKATEYVTLDEDESSLVKVRKK